MEHLLLRGFDVWVYVSLSFLSSMKHELCKNKKYKSKILFKEMETGECFSLIGQSWWYSIQFKVGSTTEVIELTELYCTKAT